MKEIIQDCVHSLNIHVYILNGTITNCTGKLKPFIYNKCKPFNTNSMELILHDF